MKTLVAVKQVCARDSEPRLDGGALDESGLTFEINEPDAYALEAALRLRDEQGGEVVAVSVGPERVEVALREALAKGADRAVHVVVDALAGLDPLGVATLLAGVAREEQPDLVLTGLQSDDMANGQTGVVLAELLGYAHTTLAAGLAVENGALRVKRELEGGWYQHVTLALPAVVGVQSGIHPLRYATLLGIRKARTKEIRAVSATAPPPVVRLTRVEMPRRASGAVFLEGPPDEQARQLVERLKTEARAL
jgi:electron transfer flavoprotein beta subunit